MILDLAGQTCTSQLFFLADEVVAISILSSEALDVRCQQVAAESRDSLKSLRETLHSPTLLPSLMPAVEKAAINISIKWAQTVGFLLCRNVFSHFFL